MRIGSSIGLVAVGLILALAVNIPIKGLDLHQIGWILVFVGVVGLVVSLLMARRSRPAVVREAYPPVPEEEVVRERPVARETYPAARQDVAPPMAQRDLRYQDPNAL
jgi:predicted MFS family arabinose efflux permease